MSQSKHVLILTSDTGFGHRRAAEAVKTALEEKYAEQCQVTVANPLQNPDVPSVIKQLETGYDEMVMDDPTLYMIGYYATDAPVVSTLVQRATTYLLNNAMLALLSERQPDVVITTYPALTQAIIRARQKLETETPIGVIVTDLVDVHSLWFNPEAGRYFVPTGAVYRQALESKVPRERIHLTGLPVHPDFARKRRSRAEIRQALGWQPDVTTALIVGSARTRQTAQIAHLLDRSGLQLQIAIVGGDDPQFLERLRAIKWKGCVHVYGFVANMPEMMHAADFVVCKAGGLIVSEALACGLPLILHEALPGQEVGNVRYVVESGVGAWSPGPIGVLTTVYAWLASDTELAKRRAAVRQVGRPRAAYDIADQIMKMA
jgi:1,2-diacylglycerol 3-beta-galactosyltransferase